MPNVYSDIPDDLPDELIQTLASKGDVRIERIVSRGHASEPDFWYDQPGDEFVVLLSGQATLEFAPPSSTRIELKPGDYRLIPARMRHRVVETALDRDTVWLAIHF